MLTAIMDERESPTPALNGKGWDLCFTGETKAGYAQGKGRWTEDVSPVKPTLAGRVDDV
jgi:hypothetical protein